jgi:hypothetical protein
MSYINCATPFQITSSPPSSPLSVVPSRLCSTPAPIQLFTTVVSQPQGFALPPHWSNTARVRQACGCWREQCCLPPAIRDDCYPYMIQRPRILYDTLYLIFRYSLLMCPYLHLALLCLLQVCLAAFVYGRGRLRQRLEAYTAIGMVGGGRYLREGR